MKSIYSKVNTLVLALGMFTLSSLAQQPDRYSKVKIYLDNQSLATLQVAGLDIDHGEYTREENAFITSVRHDKLPVLRKDNVRFVVLIENEQQEFLSRNNPKAFYSKQDDSNLNNALLNFETPCGTVTNSIMTPAAFTAGSMGGYYTYAEMITRINNMKTDYPTLVDTFTIGYSWEGRRMIGVKISDNAGTDEPEAEVLFTGLQHAREAITMTSLVFTMQYLLENYNRDVRVRELVDSREQFFIPCMNPDGYVYNQTISPNGGGTWRKNRRNNGGSYGVDLNRNYSVDWGCCNGGSATPSSDTYWGPSAFSEPETQALRDFVTTRNFTTGLDQHAYGGYYSLPFGIAANHTYTPKDALYYSYTSALMGRNNCHFAGNSMQTVGYNVAGGIKDWLLLGDIGTGSKEKIYSFTSEANGGSFWPSAANIIPLSKELCFQNLQTAYTAGAYADLQDLNDITLTSTTGNLNYLLRNIGLQNEPVTVTLIPLENMESAGNPITTTIPDYYGTSNGSIAYTLNPSIQNGERIRFIWSVQTNGITINDTITRFFNPLTLLADNMEGTFNNNWSSSSWGFTTSAAYAGNKSMSESPTGRYPAKITRTVNTKNTLNLSGATAAYLSFWVKHETQNCYDNLRIEVSTNGKQYTPICGRTTVTENKGALGGKPSITGIRNAWTRETIDLKGYLGVSQLRLRFTFVSNTDTLKGDGFYIDDIKVIKSTAPSGLREEFVNISGSLVDKNLVQLNWEAFTDDKHDFFEIQKSADGKSFSTIGSVNTQPPYLFYDRNAGEGLNHYRIRQVNKNNVEKISSTLKIKVGATYSVLLYPNPVTDYSTLQISYNKNEKIELQVFRADGRLLHKQSANLYIGDNYIRLNTSLWDKSMHIVKIVTSKNEILDVLKVSRQ